MSELIDLASLPTSEEVTASMTEEEKHLEYAEMIARGLSKAEAHGTLWPEEV